jgi:hypothetical protein
MTHNPSLQLADYQSITVGRTDPRALGALPVLLPAPAGVDNGAGAGVGDADDAAPHQTSPQDPSHLASVDASPHARAHAHFLQLSTPVSLPSAPALPLPLHTS